MKKRQPIQPPAWHEKVLDYLPWAVLGLAVLYAGVYLVNPGDARGELKIQGFASLPIREGGRVKPIDTVARNSLMLISRRPYLIEADGTIQPAAKWFLDVISGKGDDHQIFYVENEQVREVMGLPRRQRFLYSYKEIFGSKEQEEALKKQEERLENVNPDTADLLDSKIFELVRRVALYRHLRALVDTEIFAKLPPQQLKQFLGMLWNTRHKSPQIIPFQNDQNDLLQAGEWDWQVFGIMFFLGQQGGHGGEPAMRAVGAYINMSNAYARGDAYNFNKTLDEYQAWLELNKVAKLGTVDFESSMNRFAPFSRCLVLYVIAALLACISWMILPTAGRDWMNALNRSAFWLVVFTFAIHSFAMLARMIINQRPPVTNLYSSAVFIGWCAVGVGMILERVFRIGIGNAIAGVIGFATCIVANHLASEGKDTMEMLQAVLDTNFWLWTHVTCVTFGYAATFIAGFVGVLFILFKFVLWGLDQFETRITPAVDGQITKIFGQLIYGIVCFATFLSFTGTVLGGIWADQSWGRFWGWDPKENGAVLIVIWNALILHARWAGLVKVRGMAMLTIVGNMITAWSWFGTNQLGIGLHAYGFNKELAEGCRWFWVSQVGVILLGALPWDRWRSPYAESVGPVKPDKKKPHDRPDDGGNGQPAPKAEVDTAIKAGDPVGV